MKQINLKLNERQANMLIAILDKELDNANIEDIRLAQLVECASKYPDKYKNQYFEQYEQNQKYIDRLKDIKKALGVK